ncbi:tyrosine-protein phosphatase [Maribacter sp. HTCC2170]|uniref:tyrosine-protein phosphatase n=1 Tax=Maribacter sp. (strain HTCC2170 / KCCM 42371) TaxID=313603 RepID=UPI0002D65C3A|nr:CpsB/CapC family capsule biosynthesis tyrosine phosphatase [Maribacter sp. HTCC2170]
MFSFFTKKEFLVDHLEGFVDIHNHILPGIDDGAKTVEESIALIQEFAGFGVTKFIATPHIMHNYYPNNPETINSSLVILKNELLKNGMKEISLQASAEHMIDDNFEIILEEGKVMPIGQFHLLVEMSYLQPSLNFKEAIEKVVSNNYFAILAHPERYGFMHKQFKQYASYKKRGIHFQLNILSLGDFYGKEIPKITHRLLDDHMIDFIASDVHNMHQLNALKELTISNKALKHLIPIINNTIETFY